MTDKERMDAMSNNIKKLIDKYKVLDAKVSAIALKVGLKNDTKTNVNFMDMFNDILGGK